MTAARRLLTLALTTLLAAALLAGCASDAPEGDGAASDGGNGVGTAPTPDTDAGATPPPADTADDGSGDMARWYAFAFDSEVQPASGGAGRIEEFSFRSTRDEGGRATVLDVRVEVLGASTVPVRTTRMDMATFESTTVETPLELQHLRHSITVVSDEGGELTAGDEATVDLYVPVDELGADAYSWFFTKMVWTDETGEQQAWEWHVTPEMQAEMDAGGAMYMPYSEGSATDWWGFEIMTTTYGLGIFSGFATGDTEFEEGSYSFGGYSHSTTRETFRIGGYTFDGWSVRTQVTTAEGSGEWSFQVSPDLPIPIAYRMGNTGGGSNAIYEYELRDLRLS